MGSKIRIAKSILPIMLSERKVNQVWVEPFVGGANIIDKVPGNRIGNDSNKYLIALLKEMQTQIPLTPPSITEAYYKEIQNNKDKFPDWLVGYVEFNLSYGAKFFGGYGRAGKNFRNYQNEALLNILKQQALLAGISFVCSDYSAMNIPDKSFIYCDPPYYGKTQYHTKFDSFKFYDWCKEMKGKSHTIFISEYHMPDCFKCIWEKEVFVGLDFSNKAVEKLFVV